MKILIWEVRDNRQMSLTELSKKTGISKSALDDFENYKYSPTLKKLERIAKALNCRMTDLFESKYK